MSSLQPVPVRWGVLGPGAIASRFVRDMRRLPQATAVAVGSRSEGRALAFAAEFDIPRWYGDYRDLVADPEVDIVYVSTPQSLHYRHALDAIRHGKSVLVEKPIAMTVTEVNHLVLEADRADVLLMDGMWTLCNPLVKRLALLVQGGAFGAVQSLSATVGILGVQAGHRALQADLGGSFIFECMVYPAALANLLLPNATSALRTSVLARGSGGVDTFAAVHCELTDGVAMSFNGGYAVGATGMSDSRLQLIGEEGWAEIGAPIFNPTTLTWSTEGSIKTEKMDSALVGYGYEIAEACRAVRMGLRESPDMPLAQSVQTIQLLERLRYASDLDRTPT